MELLQGISHTVIITSIDRIKSTKHHRRGLPVSRKCLSCTVVRICNCVTDLSILDVLNTCRDKANLTCFKFFDYMHSWSKHAHFRHFEDFSRGHHFHRRTFGNPTLDNPNVRNSSFISIKFGIEYQSLQRSLIVPSRSRNSCHNPFQDLFYPNSRLCRSKDCFTGI